MSNNATANLHRPYSPCFGLVYTVIVVRRLTVITMYELFKRHFTELASYMLLSNRHINNVHEEE